MKIFLFIFLLLFSQLILLAQPQQIKNFFASLIKNKNGVSQYVHPEELKKAHRLGIEYTGVRNKFLISYDIEEKIKEKIIKGDDSYEILYEDLEDNFSKAVFKLTGSSYSKDFYFLNEKLISPSLYYTRDWKESESKYFKIFLSDPVLFNDYSMNQLDSFVDVMLDLLKVSQTERKLLEREKIIYILCKDENEIKKVSGFNTRGISILAYDEIITTYNCHFHETAHLLINFKLKNLPLYTLPFFQEGFATAVGGRGGLGRNVLLDIGVFLNKSKFIPFNSIIIKSDFYSEDASLTYPVAAIYNLFLMEEIGIEAYLEMYLNYSGDNEFVSELDINSIQLPSLEKFNLYLMNHKNNGGVFLEVSQKFTSLIDSKAGAISESENYYMIKTRSNLILKTAKPVSGYQSNKFKEVFPNVDYDGYKYLIKADTREVNIYNLYTNILIASYSAGFTIDNKGIPNEEGYFIFYVDKDVFEESLNDLIILEI